jgi:para-nitrobenzyl esterase
MDAQGKSRWFGWVAVLSALVLPSGARADGPVRIDAGEVRGTVGLDPAIRVFKGIPFAAPPVGELRWRAPQPVKSWTGVREATHFGPRAMQGPIYSDMIFRDNGPAEDCLYLNVWTPAKSANERLPVMVWIYGGGFQAGSASEPRQDGENLAKKGVVVVSLTYRLGVFGFLAHPELTKESGHAASGNYGLMDQIAALQWVQRNIAAFGGDPGNVTIFGESAGSMSVSALMTSSLARGLFHKAIGQSGALFQTRDGSGNRDGSFSDGERLGTKFAAAAGARSLAELRALPAEAILKTALGDPAFKMGPVFDGYVLPKDPEAAWSAGQQNQVPLLAGWNADENRVYATFGDKRPTAKGFVAETRARYGERADAILKLYPANTDEQAVRSAGDLACDQFIVYGTWKWIELQRETSGSPVFRYSFDRAVPVAPGTVINGEPASSADMGARHAADIPYVFGALASVPDVSWEAADGKLADAMATYWTNFAKTGNPNGAGLPDWPRYEREAGYPVLHLDTQIQAKPETHRERYVFWSADAAQAER